MSCFLSTLVLPFVWPPGGLCPCVLDVLLTLLCLAIDYITDLIAQRTALQQRLELARGVLPLGHPATAIEPRHLDGSGIPLWEREWNGGMDLDLGGEGSDDDS